MTPDKYTAITDAIWDECEVYWHSMIDTDTKDDVKKFISKSIASAVEAEKYDSIHSCHDECQRAACVRMRERIAAAVEAEKAKARVEWPSWEKFSEWYENKPGLIVTGKEVYDWLLSKAKIVWGEK